MMLTDGEECVHLFFLLLTKKCVRPESASREARAVVRLFSPFFRVLVETSLQSAAAVTHTIRLNMFLLLFCRALVLKDYYGH